MRSNAFRVSSRRQNHRQHVIKPGRKLRDGRFISARLARSLGGGWCPARTPPRVSSPRFITRYGRQHLAIQILDLSYLNAIQYALDVRQLFNSEQMDAVFDAFHFAHLSGLTSHSEWGAGRILKTLHANLQGELGLHIDHISFGPRRLLTPSFHSPCAIYGLFHASPFVEPELVDNDFGPPPLLVYLPLALSSPILKVCGWLIADLSPNRSRGD
ncbi:hypothetical protein R3P38DRAFT_3189129 [Favolaschia claudopus]|uniref:Uncharacterized protein n=1 Tax=Favolaschia claudopus TaxID=2862362 RepID=A0AAW0BUD2_9AGAR